MQPYFIDQLFPTSSIDKWGYIDSSEKVIIPYQFSYAYPFNGGYAWVVSNDSLILLSYILHEAAKYKAPAADIEMLLRYGADPSVKDLDGRTAYDILATNKPDIIKSNGKDYFNKVSDLLKTGGK